ncbi:hypothetical protein D5S17_25215 [Pseudonocardiaceae bacterium YIM PH 21723]|nr:hypothetical protein D5S17_25215 [Pseudonocardiaceae bacterium YIM PH 21723]
MTSPYPSTLRFVFACIALGALSSVILAVLEVSVDGFHPWLYGSTLWVLLGLLGGSRGNYGQACITTALSLLAQVFTYYLVQQVYPSSLTHLVFWSAIAVLMSPIAAAIAMNLLQRTGRQVSVAFGALIGVVGKGIYTAGIVDLFSLFSVVVVLAVLVWLLRNRPLTPAGIPWLVVGVGAGVLIAWAVPVEPKYMDLFTQ